MTTPAVVPTRKNYLAVSHRWMEALSPDGDGTQYRAIKEHLKKHPEIKYVWCDWSVHVAGCTHGRGKGVGEG